MINYLLLTIMTMIGSVAALFLKKGAIFHNFKGLIFNGNLYIGAFLYFLTALINVYVLKYLEYSVVLPFTALTYVWTTFLSKIFFGDILTLRKIIGLASIICGVILINM